MDATIHGAVSYTHLDVYKRQLKSVKGLASLDEIATTPIDDFYDKIDYKGYTYSVSYTHLDVYKRQPVIFPLPVQKGLAEAKLSVAGRRGRESPFAFPL